MAKKTIKSVEEELLKFVEANSVAQKEMNRIKSLFDLHSYDSIDELISSIGALRERFRKSEAFIKSFEGEINRENEALRTENFKLWYLIRVSLKDPSILEEPAKPGEELSQNSLRKITNPFLNNL